MPRIIRGVAPIALTMAAMVCAPAACSDSEATLSADANANDPAKDAGDIGKDSPISTDSPAPRDAPSTATGKFYIVGKDIVDPLGNKFLPFGANVGAKVKKAGQSAPSYVFDFGGTAEGHSAEAVAWGWNAIRVNLVCHYGDGYATPQEVVDGMDAIVAEYTSKKMVVMLECHDDTGQTLPLSDVAMQDVEAFWGIAMSKYKDNPYVWFNPLNELTAGTSPTEQSYWTTIHDHFLAKRDAVGAENVFVADIPGYAQGAELIATTNLAANLATTKCNVALSWHAYGGASNAEPNSYDGWVRAIQAKGIALLFGEYGYRVDNQPPYGAIAFATSVAATDAVLSFASLYGAGSFAWHATGDSHNNLLFSLSADNSAASASFAAHATGAGLSPFGQKVWNAGHAKPSLGAFTGDVRKSRCKSALQ